MPTPTSEQGRQQIQDIIISLHCEIDCHIIYLLSSCMDQKIPTVMGKINDRAMVTAHIKILEDITPRTIPETMLKSRQRYVPEMKSFHSISLALTETNNCLLYLWNRCWRIP